jgi:hypothetical protein
MNSSDIKPGRPVGLTLAILLSVFLYAVIPLLMLGYRLLVQDRLSRVDSPVVFEGEEYRALASGGSFQLTTNEIVVQTIAILIFLIVAYLAWRGGRKWVRTLFTSTVLFYGGLTAIFTLRDLLVPSTIDQGITSLDTLIAQGLCSVLVTTVLVPLYVLWYVNRAPARAFYRGTYLPPETGVQ